MFNIFKKKKPLSRKEKTENILRPTGLKINAKLPNIEPESETHLRSLNEIARRVSILCVTNLVAFENINGEQARHYLERFDLWNDTTPKEKDFLSNPTDERKNQETWKCECIWTLMWALGEIEDLGFPNTLCDLSQIPADRYPVGADKDPNDFINSISTSRTKTEILDANDLYYRIEWACVDARINNRDMKIVNPGVVYERHYALNWLVHYMEQDWDDISCDT